MTNPFTALRRAATARANANPTRLTRLVLDNYLRLEANWENQQ